MAGVGPALYSLDWFVEANLVGVLGDLTGVVSGGDLTRVDQF